MIAIVKLKSNMAGIHIFNIIIYKFRHRKKSYSIIWLSIDKNTMISSDYTILSFNLAVGLYKKYNK